MIAILVSLTSFLLGLIALRRIFVLERSVGSPLFPLTFVYYMVYIAVSFSGLLIAMFDQGYFYSNLQGRFEYSDGMVRFQLVNLISIYAGLIGVRIAIIGRQPASRQRGKPPFNPSQYIATVLASQNRALGAVCYISLTFHTFIVGLQWYGQYRDFPTFLQYPIQVLAPIVLATFFFWGLWWQQAYHNRLVLAVYCTIFGFVQMASGHRGTFLGGVLLFFAGYMLVRNWRLGRRGLAAIAVLALLLLLLIPISENLRTFYGSRRPADLAEWSTRGRHLLRGGGIFEQTAEWFSSALFRTGVTMNQLSTFDVVSRTPEYIPFAGWSEEDWDILFRGWLPEFAPTDNVTASRLGQLALLEYGWEVNPGFGHAMPMTLLADSWRRFGILGVVMVHFIWAVLLIRFSIVFRQRYLSVKRLVFSGSLVAVTYYFFNWDIVALVTNFPRRILACLLYTTIVYAVYYFYNYLAVNKSSPQSRYSDQSRFNQRRS